MDDQRVGAALRAVRIRRRMRQADLARAAGVSASLVSLIERGHLEAASLRTVRTVAAVLDVRLGVVARWRGGDLDRMLAAGHAALHESVARFFATLPDWEIAPEVSFSIYGERGVIDILAWHAASRTLLVIELKTEIVDVHALMATTDRYVRLAPRVAADRGWRPARVARWVIVSDTTSNRDRARKHAAVLAAAFPCNGRRIHAWLRSPDQIVSGLSFWSNSNASGVMEVASTRKRVRARRSPGAGA